jgi:hypothetical protein
MITLIAAVRIVIATIIAAARNGKIRAGWTPPKFATQRDGFLVRKRKEYSALAWLGVIGGPAWMLIGVGVLDWNPPEAYIRIGIGVVFIICGVVMFTPRASLPPPLGETR